MSLLTISFKTETIKPSDFIAAVVLYALPCIYTTPSWEVSCVWEGIMQTDTKCKQTALMAGICSSS